MKKEFFLLVLLIAGLSLKSFSQIDNNYKVEIKNENLRTLIKEYDSYLKKWTLPNKVKNYIMCLDYVNHTEFNKITLSAIVFEKGIDIFNPYLYAIVDSVPVIIRTSLNLFLTNNKILATTIKKQYWKIDHSDKKIYDQQLAEYNKSKPDSITKGSKNGPIKVSTKSFLPVKIDLETASIKFSHSDYILKFRGDSLVEKTITQEKRFQ